VLADGLGGKGYMLFGGPVVEVEAAVEIGAERAGNRVIGSRVIALLHDEMDANLAADGRFGARVRTT
jgi:microcompartment protein CcmL/EutN